MAKDNLIPLGTKFKSRRIYAKEDEEGRKHDSTSWKEIYRQDAKLCRPIRRKS